MAHFTGILLEEICLLLSSPKSGGGRNRQRIKGFFNPSWNYVSRRMFLPAQSQRASVQVCDVVRLCLGYLWIDPFMFFILMSPYGMSVISSPLRHQAADAWKHLIAWALAASVFLCFSPCRKTKGWNSVWRKSLNPGRTWRSWWEGCWSRQMSVAGRTQGVNHPWSPEFMEKLLAVVCDLRCIFGKWNWILCLFLLLVLLVWGILLPKKKKEEKKR